MKKSLFIVFCLFFIIIVPIHTFADILLLDAVVATGAGTEVRVQSGTSTHTIICYYVDSNASISALAVRLEGCIDLKNIGDGDGHWFNLGEKTFSAGELTSKESMFHIVNKNVPWIRANIVTLTGLDGADTVSVHYDAGK